MINRANLKLFVDRQFVSPYAMSVFVTLVEKGIPFDIETIDLKNHQNLQLFYQDNSLTARVPAIEHNDFWLSESTAIIEYIEAVFPAPEYPSIFPQNILDRSRARQIQAWLRSDLMPIREQRPTELIFFEAATITTPLADAGKIAATKLIRVAESLLAGNSSNLFGEWCIADTDLALMLNRLILNGDQVPEQLCNYANFQWKRPAVRQWAEQNRTKV
jgi:glutathione S-transferase